MWCEFLVPIALGARNDWPQFWHLNEQHQVKGLVPRRDFHITKDGSAPLGVPRSCLVGVAWNFLSPLRGTNSKTAEALTVDRCQHHFLTLTWKVRIAPMSFLCGSAPPPPPPATFIENCNKRRSHKLNTVRVISPIRYPRRHDVQMKKQTILITLLISVDCVNVFHVTFAMVSLVGIGACVLEKESYT